MSAVGRRVRRREDARLLRGSGRFVDDLDHTGQLHLRVVRSTVAHARLAGVDGREALALPGVTAVFTARDFAGLGPIPVRLEVSGQRLGPFLQPVMAHDRVRYVGEPIAAVVAEDPYLAEDAAELVAAEYEELPVVLEAEAALASEAPALFDAGNQAAVLEVGYGDVDAAIAGAAHVVALTLAVGRHSAVPLEPRGLLAELDPVTGRLDVWGATKVPQFNRKVIASMLGLPERLVRMHAIDAGGGFGVRGELYPEDLLVPWIARRLRRPVKWTEDRAEHLVAVNHSRQQRHRVQAAFDAEGRILALLDEVVHDNGAYVRTHGVTVPELTMAMLPGPYRVPAYAGRIRVALTNKTPCGTYRSPGRYEGTFVREHLLDVAADRIGLDRVELRRRNLLGPGEIPHVRPLRTLGTDVVLDVGDYPALLDRALEHIERQCWRELVGSLRAGGRAAGLGLALFLEKSGLGPYETADVVVDTSGTVHVYSGGTSLGQGIQTVLGQIAAEQLGTSPERVEVVCGDTELQPDGLGSWASRSTVVAGSAVHQAAAATAARARQVAARMLNLPPDRLRLAEGSVSGAGESAARVTLGQIAAACGPGGACLRPGEAPGLGARRRFDVDRMTYPYGVHVAVVEIDRDTGAVLVRRYLIAYEVGRAVNPTLVEGQLVGGMAQGVGGALLEEFHYDDAGQPQAASFVDYLLPTAAEVPRVDTIVTEDAPSPGNPIGAMGAGEGGVNAVGAAIANAVRDALGLRDGVGALPLSPERVAGLAPRPPRP